MRGGVVAILINKTHVQSPTKNADETIDKTILPGLETDHVRP